MQGVFFVAACASVLAVALICIFLFANGIPAIKEIGFVKFITGEMWRPSNELFGIFPMIIGSLYVTAGAVIIGVPIGILTSVFMAMYCPKKIYRPLKAATELLAGIPSVVYGFFGLVVVVPIIRDFGRALKDAGLIKNAGDGNSILTTSLILAGVILAIGRIVGETAALIYTAGSVAQIPKSVMGSGRTLAVHMYHLSSEGLYMDQAYATAVILLVLVVGINTLSGMIARKLTKA